MRILKHILAGLGALLLILLPGIFVLALIWYVLRVTRSRTESKIKFLRSMLQDVSVIETLPLEVQRRKELSRIFQEQF